MNRTPFCFLVLLVLLPAASAHATEEPEATFTHIQPVLFDDGDAVRHERTAATDALLRPCGSDHFYPLPDGVRFAESAAEQACGEFRVRLDPPAQATRVVVTFDAAKYVIRPAQPGIAETPVDLVTQLVFTKGPAVHPMESRSFFDRSVASEITSEALQFEKMLDGTFDGVGWYFDEASQSPAPAVTFPTGGTTTQVDIVRPMLHYPDLPLHAAVAQVGEQADGETVRTTFQVRVVVDASDGDVVLHLPANAHGPRIHAPDGTELPAHLVHISDDHLTIPTAVLLSHGPGPYTATVTIDRPLTPHPWMMIPVFALVVAPLALGIYGAFGVRQLVPRTTPEHAPALMVLRWALAGCWAFYATILAITTMGQLWPLTLAWPLATTAAPIHLLLATSALAFGVAGVLGRRMLVRHIEASLQQQQRLAEELRRSNLDLERFAQVTGHDLRDPLQSVQGYAQLLERHYGDKLDGPGREYLAACLAGAKHMDRVIQDMMEQGRAEAPPPGRVHLGSAVDAATSALAERIRAADATITCANLPFVDGHTTQLSRLFQNLMSNAIKFCPAGRQPRIHVSASRRRNRWIVRVRDNGVGLDAKQSASLFAIFSRGEQEAEGSGIGLASCRRIMERHGGTIRVAPRHRGVGTTFELVFPLPPDTRKAVPIAHPRTAAST